MSTRLVHQDLFGGRGKVTVDLELEGAPPAFACVLRCALAPRGKVGTHQQEDCDEVLVVLAGSGRAHVDARLIPLKSGVVVPVPLGATLSLENTSRTAPLGYLILKAQPNR